MNSILNTLKFTFLFSNKQTIISWIKDMFGQSKTNNPWNVINQFYNIFDWIVKNIIITVPNRMP